jgi:hypothetical protein
MEALAIRACVQTADALEKPAEFPKDFDKNGG